MDTVRDMRGVNDYRSPRRFLVAKSSTSLSDQTPRLPRKAFRYGHRNWLPNFSTQSLKKRVLTKTPKTSGSLLDQLHSKQKPWRADDYQRIQEMKFREVEETNSLSRGFGQRKLKVGINPSQDHEIQAMSKDELLDSLRSLVEFRNYRGANVGETLLSKMESLFDGPYEIDDLKKEAFIETQDSGIAIDLYDWFEQLFKNSKPGKEFKHFIGQFETEHNDLSLSEDRAAALRLKNNYAKNNFYQLRAELALEYLKASGKIIDYMPTVKNSYLDHLGIDLLVRANIDGEKQIFAIQVKGSEKALKEFSDPVRLALFNFRESRSLFTENQREGIFALRVDRSSIDYLADRIDKLVSRADYREHNSVKLLPNFDFKKNLSLDKLKAWYKTIESTFIENSSVGKARAA